MTMERDTIEVSYRHMRHRKPTVKEESVSSDDLSVASGDESLSDQSSTERSPAPTEPEIVVWGDEMDIESEESGSELSEAVHMDTDDDSGQSVDDDDNDEPSAPVDGPAESFTSSLSAPTEGSDISPAPSASSKATTPLEPEGQRDYPRAREETISLTHSRHDDLDQLHFTVRPKSSIPSNISPLDYASECIAAADSSRLNPYALHPEEYHLLRHHISHTQVTTYLNIRNSILRLWLTQPWVMITKEQAVGCAGARWFDAASVCYDWLCRRGYINFGCAKMPAAKTINADAESSGQPARKKRKVIAVIGAGISGLGCARQLDGLFKQYADRFDEQNEEPPEVVILEARSRVGGRVYSREFKTTSSEPDSRFSGKRHTAEMGGMIITGFDRGNPMNVLVRGQLGLPYHALSPDTTIYDYNGRAVDPTRDQLVEKLYNDCLDRVSEFKYKPPLSKVIEGSRALIDEGRDSPGDGSKTIMQAEEAEAALPHALPVAEQSVPERVNMVPVSSDKLTGRVHTLPGVAATLKASEKAKQMGWALKKGDDDGNIDLNQATTAEGATLGSTLDYAISQYKKLVNLEAQDYRLINWHIANLEYSNATNLHRLSLDLWDIDAGNEWEGQHTMVVGGYQSVARGLLHCPESLNLRHKHPVSRIKYDVNDAGGRAEIHCEDGTVIHADSVVCTVPLGVLKHESIEFDPPLPSWKAEAIGRLGFGILNKVVLVYDKVFWESDRHIFGVLRESTARNSVNQSEYSQNRGRFFQWFNVSNTTGLPCLIALMAGDAGFDTEHYSNDDLVQEASDVLRSVFGKAVPQPVEAVVTRWGSDRFARGSYSSAAPSMRPEDYDVMARSTGNLYFAGEHTIGTHPATVHGAYLSGLRAASEVLESLLGPVEVPTPLILPRDSVLLHKRKLAASDPKQARLDAYEAKVWDYIRSKIGERPARPAKIAGNAYILFSKAKYDVAKQRCHAAVKVWGRAKSGPNEVRAMTSKMWKEATPEEKSPFEEQASEQKKAYAEATQKFLFLSQAWDSEAMVLRDTYERKHPSEPLGHPQKHRRLRAFGFVDAFGGGELAL